MKIESIKRFINTYSFLKGNVGVLIIARIIWSLSSLGTRSFLSLYILALGGSAASMGLFNTLASISQFITRPIGGYLADSSDRRKVMGVGTMMLSLSYITYVLAPNVTMLLIGTLIINMFFLHDASMQSLVADSLSNEQMAIGYSTQLAIERVIPFFLAFIGGILIDTIGIDYGMRLSYTSYVIGGLIIAYIRYRFTKETRTLPKKKLFLQEIPATVSKSYKEIFSFLRHMSRELKVVTVISTLGSVSALLTAPFWSIYAIERIGLTPPQFGFIIMVSGILQVVTSFLSGHLINKLGRKRTIIVSLFLISSLTFTFVYCHTFEQVLVFWALVSVLLAFITPAFQALFMTIVPSHQRGRAIAAVGQNSFNVLRTNIGVMVGLGFFAYIPAIGVSLSSGYLYDFNPRYPWFLLSATFFILALLVWFFIPEQERKRNVNS